MRLSYRGTPYDVESVPLELIDSGMVGQYRGHQIHFNYARHIPVPQPVQMLSYRGAAYHTTATGSIEPIATARRQRSAVTAEPAWTIADRAAHIAELERVHRLNIQRRLQHRIEVAKAKGDTLLLNQLEQEMRQGV